MHASDHHYGIGVFEGVRAYGSGDRTSIFRLKDHTARLFRSAHIMKIGIPQSYTQDHLNDVQVELLRRNKLLDAYLRPFVFLGGAMGLSLRTRDLSVHVAVFALEWTSDGAYRKGDAGTRGLSLRTAAFTRHSASSLLSKAKANANYLSGILALRDAEMSGGDEALLLDGDGFVTETSGANLFVVRGDVIYTPPLEFVLEGVTRDTIMTLAADIGKRVVERRLSRDEVYIADEVFVTGTAAEVTPIREFDGRRIGDGKRGPVTEQLQAMYAALVRGHGEEHGEWLSWI
jgi:branched-chain amino acid aminotransferase